MVFEHIHKLQEELTDKYVTVDESRPELKRFGGLVGRVKTVNFSGRALVEFDEWIANIGWFDIDTSFLKIADPDEVARIAAKKEAGKKAHKPPAGEKPAKEAKTEKAAPAKAPAGEKKGGMSVAEMMAAARGSAGAAPAAKKEGAPAKATPAAGGEKKPAMSVAEMMAAARASAGGAVAAAPAKKTEPRTQAAVEAPPADVKKEAPAKPAAVQRMTVEQMLKMARDQASGKAPPATDSPAPKEETPAPAAKAAAPTPEPPPAAPAKAEAPKGNSGPLPKDVAGIVAYCRQADNK